MIKLKSVITEIDCLRICQAITTLKNTWGDAIILNKTDERGDAIILNKTDELQLQWLWILFDECQKLAKQQHKIKIIVE